MLHAGGEFFLGGVGLVMVDQGLLLQAGGEGVLGNKLLEMKYWGF